MVVTKALVCGDDGGSCVNTLQSKLRQNLWEYRGTQDLGTQACVINYLCPFHILGNHLSVTWEFVQSDEVSGHYLHVAVSFHMYWVGLLGIVA